MAKKKNRQNLFGVAVIVIIAAVLTQVLFSVFAATGALSLSATKQSVNQGEEVEVVLRANTDTEASVVQARVTFDPAQLQYVSVSYNGSPFDTQSPEFAVGSGFIQVSRFKFPPPPYPSGDTYIATITFRGLQSSGTAGINIDQGSSVIYSASDASNIISSVSGTSVQLQSGAISNPPPPSQPSANPSTPVGEVEANTTSGSATGGSDATGTAGVTVDPVTGQTIESYATGGSTALQAPGKSQLGTNPSLVTRILAWVRAIVPYVVVLSVLAVIVYFASKKLQQHSHSTATISVGGNNAASTNLSTAPSVKENKPNTGSPGPGYGVLIGKDDPKNK